MRNKKDSVDQMFSEEMDREAEEIERELEEDSQIYPTPEAKARIRQGIEKGIEQQEKQILYSQLSDHDQRALKLGQKMLKEENHEEHGEEPEKPARKAVVYRKRVRKVYVALAAVLVMVIAMGVTSVGRPKRFAKVEKQQVGEREVSKINSGENIAQSAEEKEDEAYQEINDTFGVAPVQISVRPEGMAFKQMNVDDFLQMVEMVYTYKGGRVTYYISLDYSTSAWGVDTDDPAKREWKPTIQNCPMEIKQYETPKTKTERYAVEFVYKDVGYHINGTMGEEELMLILNNLHFL